MKFFLQIFIFTLFSINGYSQSDNEPRSFISKFDTTKTDLRILNYVKDNRNWGGKDQIAFRNKTEAKIFADSNKFGLPVGFDYFNDTTKTLAIINYSGIDCHSNFDFKFERDDAEMTYRLYVYIRDGGCRAGGKNYTSWVSFTKKPDDYRFEVIEAVIKKQY